MQDRSVAGTSGDGDRQAPGPAAAALTPRGDPDDPMGRRSDALRAVSLVSLSALDN